MGFRGGGMGGKVPVYAQTILSNSQGIAHPDEKPGGGERRVIRHLRKLRFSYCGKTVSG